MAERDYYTILGVERNATPEQIRKAYRDLARRHHPDVSKAPDAQTRFTELQEAYDVLSDAEKRQQYDRFGRAGMPSSEAAREGEQAWRRDFDVDDIGSMFEAFFSGRRPGEQRAPDARGARGRDLHHRLSVDFATAASGGRRSVRVVGPDGRTRTIDVTIPPATTDGTRLRVRGEGYPSTSGGPPGDLMLTLAVEPHPLFRRGRPGDAHAGPDGLDLHFELPVTFAEASIGARIPVPTPSGEVAEVVLPPGTGSGRMLRLRGRGLAAGDGRTGDLYAVVQIVSPTGDHLEPSERAALESASRRGPRPRSGGIWPGGA